MKKDTLRDVVLENVEPGSIVSTDELISYGLLEGDGFKHGAVNHSAKEWTYYDYRHDATHHTQHVELFWKLFKGSINSTHIHISQKHMDRYLGEFSFRGHPAARFKTWLGHTQKQHRRTCCAGNNNFLVRGQIRKR